MGVTEVNTHSRAGELGPIRWSEEWQKWCGHILKPLQELSEKFNLPGNQRLLQMRINSIYLEEILKLFNKMMHVEYFVQCQVLHKCKKWSENRINAQSLLFLHGINICWRQPFSDLQVGPTSALGNLFQRKKLANPGCSSARYWGSWSHMEPSLYIMKTFHFQRLKDS